MFMQHVARGGKNDVLKYFIELSIIFSINDKYGYDICQQALIISKAISENDCVAF